MARQDTQNKIDAIIPSSGWEGAPDSTNVVDALTDVLTFTSPTRDENNVPFVGSGSGATKTTPVIFGACTIAESFGLNDELYIHWVTPSNFDESQDATLEIDWAMTTSETGPVVSWEAHILVMNGVKDTTATTNIETYTDVPIPATLGLSSSASVVLDAATYFTTGVHALHIKLVRVASSSDPTGNPAVHHVSIQFGINA